MIDIDIGIHIIGGALHDNLGPNSHSREHRSVRPYLDFITASTIATSIV